MSDRASPTLALRWFRCLEPSGDGSTLKKVKVLQQFWLLPSGRDFVPALGYGAWRDVPTEDDVKYME